MTEQTDAQIRHIYDRWPGPVHTWPVAYEACPHVHVGILG